MQIVPANHQPQLRPLFDAPHFGFVVDAMQAGNSPATIWVDNVANPCSAFIWDTTHSLYVGGDNGKVGFVDDLRVLLAETILPEGRARRLGIFKIYTSSEAWAALIPDLFRVQAMPRRERILFRLDLVAVEPQPADAPPGFHIERISRDLLSDAARQNADRVLEEIESCWTSLDNFCGRGFGFCALTDTGEIAAWCTSEYVSGKTCGVGIETVEAYQGRGLGTEVARFRRTLRTGRVDDALGFVADEHPLGQGGREGGFQ